jgi:hypothetical protein
VLECSGPTHSQCPIFDSRPCDLAEQVDVMVYDAWASGDADGVPPVYGQPTGERLHAAIGRLLAEVPVAGERA